MQVMPEQCQGMMQNMQSCMATMHQMMQSRMRQGGAMPGPMGRGNAMSNQGASGTPGKTQQ